MLKLNILILNSSIIYGGGEFFVLEIAGELQKKGYTVTVGCNQKSPLYKKCNENHINAVNIDFPEKGSGRLWKNVKTIKKIIKSYKIDIVHSNTNYDRTAAAFSIRGTSAKHVTSCHSLEPISHNLTHYIRNRFLTHYFIADGESIKKLIVENNNIPENKVTVVFNGINPEEMCRDERLREKVRNEFNVNQNEILIGSVGRLVQFKGHKYLITAYRDVLNVHGNTKLMLVGDGELMNELKELSKSLDIEEKVIFTGYRDDMQAVYSAFDIYANTSVGGGGELFPFTILYALAQSLPIVAVKAGDIP
jgi:glycosyltransferase involved in cell wall biosynthesis